MQATAHDSAFCLLLGHNAVHAGMAGGTDMVVSFVIASTGQPREMR